MNRSDQQKIKNVRMREKKLGIGFETVAGMMGGGYRRNYLILDVRATELQQAVETDLYLVIESM